MAAATSIRADPHGQSPYSDGHPVLVTVRGLPLHNSSPTRVLGPLVGVLAVLVCGPGQAALVPASSSPEPQWRTVPRSSGASDAPASSWRPIPLVDGAPRSRLIPATLPDGILPEATRPDAARPDAAQAAVRIPADAQAVAAERPRLPYLISPSLGGGLPTGYVGGWGDYYIAGSAATSGKTRDGVVDGSVNMGFSLGDPERLVGFDLNWGIGSIQNFNANGSVAVAAGRMLVNRPDLQVAVAGGLLDAYTYGNEAGQPQVNGYGAVTVAVPLRPGDPRFPQRLQLSVGGGGNSFAAINANFQSTETGFFAAAGVEVLPNLGVSVGQSSRSTNLNLSWVPLRRLPVFVNVVAADLFDVTPFGTVGVLSVGWGDSLRRGGFFSD